MKKQVKKKPNKTHNKQKLLVKTLLENPSLTSKEAVLKSGYSGKTQPSQVLNTQGVQSLLQAFELQGLDDDFITSNLLRVANNEQTTVNALKLITSIKYPQTKDLPVNNNFIVVRGTEEIENNDVI